MQQPPASGLAPEQQQQMMQMRQMAQTTGGGNGAFGGVPPPPGAISGPCGPAYEFAEILLVRVPWLRSWKLRLHYYSPHVSCVCPAFPWER